MFEHVSILVSLSHHSLQAHEGGSDRSFNGLTSRHLVIKFASVAVFEGIRVMQTLVVLSLFISEQQLQQPLLTAHYAGYMHYVSA